MKYTFLSLITILVLFCSLSCNETSNIGITLMDENVSIYVDSNYTVTGRTVETPVVQSRTLSQLIGAINAPGYGTIHSDFVSQFMSSTAIDTVNMTAENIDSVKMFLQMERNAFVGDSLVPMYLDVYRITKDLPYPIYTDFNPEGYYDATAPLASAIYTASTFNEPDSIKELESIYVQLKLPTEIAREIFLSYKKNPAAFLEPDIFTKEVFKGVYVRSSYGSGRISDFSLNSMRFYYHKDSVSETTNNDTIIQYYGDYLAATPEVIVNNNVNYTPAKEILDMVAANEKIIIAPAGYEIEFEFPAKEIIANYDKYKDDLRVVNTLTFEIPVDTIGNKFNISAPPYVLMVLKNKKDEFFANNKLADNITSFYATYDSTNGRYYFSGMRDYLLNLLTKEEISADDYTFVLTPVQIESELDAYSSSYVVSRIIPYVSSPAMAKILLEDAKIIFTYSTGKNNF